MTTSTESRISIVTEGMEPTEPGEHGVHDRQIRLSNWLQERLQNATIGIEGMGGLGGKIAKNLARLGVGRLVICDFDTVETSNLSRQDFFYEQRFKNKAFAMAENLKREATSKTVIDAYSMAFQEVLQRYPDAFEHVDILACLVDNEASRLAAARFGLKHGIPVIFSAVTRNALLGYVFIQQPGGPCYNCVRPENVEDGRNECADPSVIYIHAAVMGIATYATVALLQGWKTNWNYYELILNGDSYAMNKPKMAGCELCNQG
jgi:molybdopterin/thiamine biosynthesis adenylyltransferase